VIPKERFAPMMAQEQRNQLVREHFDSRNVAGSSLCGERWIYGAGQ
jgi:hypothetical protein